MAAPLKPAVAVLEIAVLEIVVPEIVVLEIVAPKVAVPIDVVATNAVPKGGLRADAGQMGRVPIAVQKVDVPRADADQMGRVARQVLNDWLTRRWSSTRIAMVS